MSDGTRAISRVEAERCAAGDPTLRSMLAKGMPLTRDMYIAMGWGSDTPDPWDAEHEEQLPECFRRPLPKRHGYGKR